VKSSELQKFLSYLSERKGLIIDQFNAYDDSFRSVAFDLSNISFEYDFSLLSEEINLNLAFQNYHGLSLYYRGVVDDLNNEQFENSFIEYPPSDELKYYKDKEDFMTRYLHGNENAMPGEGELNFIQLKFMEYLFSYKELKCELIQLIEYKLDNQGRGSCLKKSSTEVEPPFVLMGFSDDQIKRVISEEMKYLSGVNASQQKIIENSQFEYLLSSIFHLVKTDEVTNESCNLELKGISGNTFRYTLYQIHSKLLGTNKIRDSFIHYLMNFRQYSNTNFNTHKTKFSTKPKKYPF